MNIIYKEEFFQQQYMDNFVVILIKLLSNHSDFDVKDDHID